MTAFAFPQLRAALNGISGILVTPFDEQDQLAPHKLAPIVDRAVDAGVHCLVVNGNTSEFYGLSPEEAVTMAHAATEQVGGRAPVLGGVGRDIGQACRLARESARAGASGLMVHQLPDPFVAPRGVVEYVTRVSDASGGLPVVLYLRNENIGLAAIEALCRLPGVVGIKWASPTPLLMGEAMRRTTDLDLAWVCGLAEIWAPPLYAMGARGFTSGLINVKPAHSVAIHQALEAADYPRARVLIEQMRAFEALRAEEQNGCNVSVVKAALQLLGEDCGAPRPPAAWPLTDTSAQALKQLLAGWGG
ncbi:MULTISPECIES: dihydrodipicolinate synthase family protein [unclassified Achromobacter]|uniref:dihydrodipicolinate synthase family protein n=1 Tax=unclassified Achromobacter TaxID=2626865 RepID=UPI000B51DFAD|nr:MULTISPECIES: dihydrodipicolinate synthase family protein [unclassified Achromobacter]OWT80833.1 dihydrodipicolinate synthase family protein [Achromobacter sp. HZ34]OWT81349.1 dihydrodipicolinate synthase family protein [Achromobacter sp. HZ28]